MTRNNTLRLAALLLMGYAATAAAQTTERLEPGMARAQQNSVPLPPNANTVGSGPITPVNAPPEKRPGGSGHFTLRTRKLVYIALPGSLERPVFPGGSGIVVLDADRNYAFVKRIKVFDYAASRSPEDISGVAASPATNMLYLSARGRLAALDLGTDKVVWSTTLDGQCCERPQVDADGKTLVVGSNLQDYWYKLDAKSGKLLAVIHAPGSPGAHNLNLSADGKLAFMSPNGPLLQIADVATAKVVRTIKFPDHIRVQALNADSSKIYVNQNNFLGYMIADTRTGQILKTVEVASVDWRKVWNASPRPRIPHGCPSHGIFLTQDGKEVWVADGVFKKIHIFTNDDNPREIAAIDTPDGVFWMTPSVDGKLIYASSGDIIDIASRKVVGVTKDEYGDRLFSEKELEMVFDDGRLQRVSNQFGNEYGDFVTAHERGLGPVMPTVSIEPPILASTHAPDPNAKPALKRAAK